LILAKSGTCLLEALTLLALELPAYNLDQLLSVHYRVLLAQFLKLVVEGGVQAENLLQIGKKQIALLFAEKHLGLDRDIEMILHDLQVAHMLLLCVYEFVDDLLDLHVLLGELLELAAVDVLAEVGKLLFHLHVRVDHPGAAALGLGRVGCQGGCGQRCGQIVVVIGRATELRCGFGGVSGVRGGIGVYGEPVVGVGGNGVSGFYFFGLWIATNLKLALLLIVGFSGGILLALGLNYVLVSVFFFNF